MAKASTATLQALPELLNLPPAAVEKILCSASFSGALAACSCRTLREAWRDLFSSNPEFAATALVDRFKSVETAAEHLYKPGHGLLTDPPVRSNIAPPAPGLLDAVASPLLSILSAVLQKHPPVATWGYLTATAAPDAQAVRLLRHLSSLCESSPAPVSQANNNNAGANANQDGIAASRQQAVRKVTRFPRSVMTGAAFAGHEATVVELLRLGADPIELLPGAVRAGNARLCAALLEGARMAGAACDWSTAAGGRVLGVREGPTDLVHRYAGSSKAASHMRMNRALLPLACIGLPPGLPGGSGGGGNCGACSGSSSTWGTSGAASAVCARGIGARELLQRAVDGWYSEDAGQEQTGQDVAAALAAARAAAEKAADTALGGSNPLLPLLVQSRTAAAAAAGAAATAAALAALTPPEAPCSGNSSSSAGSTLPPGQVYASPSTTTNHAAVRQLLLQWRPSEWQALPPHTRASALLHAAAGGVWSVVSELLRAGVDPRDGGWPATVLYLALVQGRGAMAAWLLARLLVHLAGVRREIVGAATAAFVTWIMGRASPLQLLLRYIPISDFEELLREWGFIVVNVLFYTYLPIKFLPPRMYLLLSLYRAWAF